MGLGAYQEWQRGGRIFTGTAADADTWLQTQRRAAEAGGWQVWATPMWVELCSRRGGGERVKTREDFDDERLRMRGGRKEEAKEKSKQMIETGRAGGLV